ncbi:MAG TPA: MerR family transcriptional regulator [Amycolatopsis sp.]|uniref:MerR family transcriptional regulator n=1 Tax=Amycolatopsis sp. TaxID=37632 RepID=UPI002B4A7715|nr:MerR family transcriptional regulator [Amycolatopsis sp.]HKS49534.1 MerR family transcriptional regulator [Amycolatopsis sp.]
MSYPIAEAARRSGLSIDTLRYYERIKLVDPPARDAAGRRAYSDDDLAWLEFLTKLRTTGMPIKMMREYAQLRRHGRAAAPRRMDILVEQRRSVRARIAELQSCLDVLDYKIDNYDRVCRELVGTGGLREEISA